MVKVQTSSDYSDFHILQKNRGINLNDSRTKRLIKSMKKYGWLVSMPASVVIKNDCFYIQDGQHRFQIAQMLNIPVIFVLDEIEVCPAELNTCSKNWTTRDYAESFAKIGVKSYKVLLEFDRSTPISLTGCIRLLSGSDSGPRFQSGMFEVKYLKEAWEIAKSLKELIDIHSAFDSQACVRALQGCYRVDYFEVERLIEGAEVMRHMIEKQMGVHGYLQLFEVLYNKGRRADNQKPLLFDAEIAQKKNLVKGMKSAKEREELKEQRASAH